ncbi:MAG: hypothetical protein CL847_02440 [Crocinitomicaceae bacterium]|nr:hypothetical protein [Crocinitomicaceae bacterium]
MKAPTSYVVTVLVLSIICTTSSAQNTIESPLLDQRLICECELSEGLEEELEECYLIKPFDRFPAFNITLRGLFNKEIAVWDQEQLEKSAFKINQKLKHKGYLQSKVVLSKNYESKKGDVAEYKIELGPRWFLGEIKWTTLQSGIPNSEVQQNTILNTGDILDIDLLEEERKRLSEQCQNSGFATFNEGFIHFEIDTSRTSGVADLEILIRGQKLEGAGDFVEHKRMKIGSIYYDQSFMSKPIGESILKYIVMLDEGKLYDPFKFESTYRRLSSVSSISSVQLAKDYPSEVDGDFGVVDVTVVLKSASRYNFSFSLDMTRADTRFGPLSSLTWKNRNLIGKGDVFSWTTTASFSSTQLFSNTDINLLPNTGELGLQMSYRRIGMPFISIENLPKSTYSHSEVILNGAIEARPEYNRSFVNLLYRVDWTENPTRMSKIIVDPIRLSYVKIANSSDFEQWLEDFGDPLTQYRFSDYANLGSSLSWSQNAKSKIFTSIEWSGQLTGLLAPIIGFDTNDNGGLEVNGLPLINYIRFDASLSKTLQFKSNDSDKIAFRIRTGSAWVGKGTEALPFDRAFYGGGANGVRGWPIRGLGGGEDLIGVGDLRFDVSLEHRKDITDAFTIAAFSDVGNVWVHDSPNKLKDLAFSMGLGFRYDLEFFLFRIDTAIRLYDPTQNQEHRWIVQSPLKGAVHFGLGHPF